MVDNRQEHQRMHDHIRGDHPNYRANVAQIEYSMNMLLKYQLIKDACMSIQPPSESISQLKSRIASKENIKLNLSNQLREETAIHLQM